VNRNRNRAREHRARRATAAAESIVAHFEQGFGTEFKEGTVKSREYVKKLCVTFILQEFDSSTHTHTYLEGLRYEGA